MTVGSTTGEIMKKSSSTLPMSVLFSVNIFSPQGSQGGAGDSGERGPRGYAVSVVF